MDRAEVMQEAHIPEKFGKASKGHKYNPDLTLGLREGQ